MQVNGTWAMLSRIARNFDLDPVEIYFDQIEFKVQGLYAESWGDNSSD